MKDVKFANGEVHDCLMCFPSDNEKWFSVVLGDVDFPQAVNIFSDPMKTNEIIYDGVLYEGYTELISIYRHNIGGICGILRGGTHRRII